MLLLFFFTFETASWDFSPFGLLIIIIISSALMLLDPLVMMMIMISSGRSSGGTALAFAASLATTSRGFGRC
jgi:hypothetical protein